MRVVYSVLLIHIFSLYLRRYLFLKRFTEIILTKHRDSVANELRAFFCDPCEQDGVSYIVFRKLLDPFSGLLLPNDLPTRPSYDKKSKIQFN